MSLIDAEKEIGTFWRGDISGLKAVTLPKQIGKKFNAIQCNMSSITWTASAGFYALQGYRKVR